MAKKKNNTTKKHGQPTPPKSRLHSGYRIGAGVLAAVIIISMLAMYAL